MANFHRRGKNSNKSVIKQILDKIPNHIFRAQINKHKSDKGCHKYKCFDQFVAMTFGQLCKCYSLSDISAGLSMNGKLLLDIGLEQNPAKSTMSDGNKNRDSKVFQDLYARLLSYHKELLKSSYQTHIIEEIKNHNIKLIDSTCISLCLNMFDWAKFRTAKGGLKIHTVWDDLLGLPELVNITEAKIHDSKGLITNVFKKGTIIVEDRAYFDFSLMKIRQEAENIFVTRIKQNTVFKLVTELNLPEESDQDILKDCIIQFDSKSAIAKKIDKIQYRLVSVYKADENKTIEILTNNLDWTARTIADLYKKRWDIELFFKAMKQNLQIKTFLGTSKNAVESQIYISMITYLLLELIRRVYCKSKTAFSNFCEKIRICLLHYITLEYICNNIKPIVRKVIKEPDKSLFNKVILGHQMKLVI